MKAITLTQPWATLVAIGAKRWETRSWRTSYRGPLAIHAAKGMPGYAKDAYFEAPFHDALCPVANGEGYNLQDLPRGEVIAIVNLLGLLADRGADCLGQTDGAGAGLRGLFRVFG